MEKKSFQENPDNHFDTEMRLRALEGAEASHSAKMADEDRLGVPSYDESMVSDWIRNRIDIPKDMIGGKGVFKVETSAQPEGDYERDLKILQALTKDQLDKLLATVENESKKDKGLFSKGDLLNGYAIDPETLQSLQTRDHHGTAKDLALSILYSMDDEKITENTENYLMRRIIAGMVFFKVPGFRTPIIKFNPFVSVKTNDKVPEDNVKKISNHLKRERKLLPITSDFQVL